MSNEILVETRLESWERGLYECSFDRREHLKIDPPTKEVVDTMNERFVVTKQEIIYGASLVRQFAEVVSLPTRFPVPEQLASLYNRIKAVYSTAISLDLASKILTRYHDSRLRKHEEKIADLDKRAATIIKFIDYIRTQLREIETDLGNPDLVDLPEPKFNKPVVVKRSISTTSPSKPRELKKSKFQLKFDDDE